MNDMRRGDGMVARIAERGVYHCTPPLVGQCHGSLQFQKNDFHVSLASEIAAFVL